MGSGSDNKRSRPARENLDNPRIILPANPDGELSMRSRTGTRDCHWKLLNIQHDRAHQLIGRLMTVRGGYARLITAGCILHMRRLNMLSSLVRREFQVTSIKRVH